MTDEVPSQGQLAKALALLGVPDPTTPGMSVDERRAVLLAHIHAWSRLLMTSAEHDAELPAEVRSANHVEAEVMSTNVVGMPEASRAVLLTSLAHRLIWAHEVVKFLAKDELPPAVAAVADLALGSLAGTVRLLEAWRARFDPAIVDGRPGEPAMDVVKLAEGLTFLAAAYDRFHEYAEPRHGGDDAATSTTPPAEPS